MQRIAKLSPKWGSCSWGSRFVPVDPLTPTSKGDSQGVEHQTEEAHKVVGDVANVGRHVQANIVKFFFCQEDVPWQQGAGAQQHEDEVDDAIPVCTNARGPRGSG